MTDLQRELSPLPIRNSCIPLTSTSTINSQPQPSQYSFLHDLPCCRDANSVIFCSSSVMVPSNKVGGFTTLEGARRYLPNYLVRRRAFPVFIRKIENVWLLFLGGKETLRSC